MLGWPRGHKIRSYEPKTSSSWVSWVWSCWNNHLGGGFKHVLFLTLPQEMIQFDSYFSDGLKPPTRKSLSLFVGMCFNVFLCCFCWWNIGCLQEASKRLGDFLKFLEMFWDVLLKPCVWSNHCMWVVQIWLYVDVGFICDLLVMFDALPTSDIS